MGKPSTSSVNWQEWNSFAFVSLFDFTDNKILFYKYSTTPEYTRNFIRDNIIDIPKNHSLMLFVGEMYDDIDTLYYLYESTATENVTTVPASLNHPHRIGFRTNHGCTLPLNNVNNVLRNPLDLMNGYGSQVNAFYLARNELFAGKTTPFVPCKCNLKLFHIFNFGKISENIKIEMVSASDNECDNIGMLSDNYNGDVYL